jgi:hypothetical protein
MVEVALSTQTEGAHEFVARSHGNFVDGTRTEPAEGLRIEVVAPGLCGAMGSTAMPSVGCLGSVPE